MTDPFLLSPDGAEPDAPPFFTSSVESPPSVSEATDEDLRCRLGVSRATYALFDRAFVEEYVTLTEMHAPLAAEIDEALTAAGLHAADERGGGSGGFHVVTWIRADAIVVSWSRRGAMTMAPEEFDDRIESVMRPALAALLDLAGFDARIIPAGEDDAGCVAVYGRRSE
ncbi:hypothetical protein [Actinomadura atramentaria]|uniref:hypothetical protein n=1 Tax=Actinomadura atramentaria TaxID=1990 RepID=UPI000382D655|nr:hypothetical protein [Actinomadura atramentaria]